MKLVCLLVHSHDKADCVTYCATESGRDVTEFVAQLCSILASGKNIVTSSLHHPLFHAPSLDDASREARQAACQERNSSLFATGIAPGFTSDILAVHAASMSELPTKVAVEERMPCGAHRVPGFFAMLGFGRTPERDAEVYRSGAMVDAVAPPMRLIAGWRRKCRLTGQLRHSLPNPRTTGRAVATRCC